MRTRISKGGQISLPAGIRRRWATESLVLEDLGTHVVLRPIPADPVAAAEGAFPSATSSERARERLRRDEHSAEARKHAK